MEKLKTKKMGPINTWTKQQLLAAVRLCADLPVEEGETIEAWTDRMLDDPEAAIVALHCVKRGLQDRAGAIWADEFLAKGGTSNAAEQQSTAEE